MAAKRRSWEKIGRHNYITIVKQWCRHLKKMVGSYQGVAFPFEMRMAIEELREVKEV